MFGGTVAPTCLWASGKPPAANLPILPATPLSCSATIGSTKALSLSCSPLQAGCSSPPREAPYSLPPSRTCACSPCRPSNGLTSQGQSLRGRWPIKCGSNLTLTGSPGAERHRRERLHHRLPPNSLPNLHLIVLSLGHHLIDRLHELLVRPVLPPCLHLSVPPLLMLRNPLLGPHPLNHLVFPAPLLPFLRSLPHLAFPCQTVSPPSPLASLSTWAPQS